MRRPSSALRAVVKHNPLCVHTHTSAGSHCDALAYIFNTSNAINVRCTSQTCTFTVQIACYLLADWLARWRACQRCRSAFLPCVCSVCMQRVSDTRSPSAAPRRAAHSFAVRTCASGGRTADATAAALPQRQRAAAAAQRRYKR